MARTLFAGNDRYPYSLARGNRMLKEQRERANARMHSCTANPEKSEQHSPPTAAHALAAAALPGADVGDFAIALGNIDASLSLVEKQADEHAHLIAFGGDHSISLPLLRALARKRRTPLALVHFDAHVDTWPDN